MWEAWYPEINPHIFDCLALGFVDCKSKCQSYRELASPKCEVKFTLFRWLCSRVRHGINVTLTPITHSLKNATISQVPLQRPPLVERFHKSITGQPTLRVNFETGKPETLIALRNSTGISSDSCSLMMAESADW